jgi:hypothetical protein
MWRLTEEEARQYGLTDKPKKRKSKYNAVRTKVDGITFDSKREAEYYSELKIRQKAGEILGFSRQDQFVLDDAGTVYRADFVIFYPDGRYEIVDVKGVKTQVFKLKMKMLKMRYPGLEVVTV